MRTFTWRPAVIVAFWVVGPGALLAQTPEVWFMPNNHIGWDSDWHGINNPLNVYALFDHPEQWREARSRIDVLGFPSRQLDMHFSDDQLRRNFALMKQWGLKLGLELGATKAFSDSRVMTGEQAFLVRKKEIDRFQRLGGKVYSIAMDIPYTTYRSYLLKKKPASEVDQLAVREVASFVALMRKEYPDMRIGEIGSMIMRHSQPITPLEDHIAHIDALQAKLKSMHVRGLDFYRVETDINFTDGVSLLDIKALQDACHARGLGFSLILITVFNVPLHPFRLADDFASYDGMFMRAYLFRMVGGAPDEWVLESWVPFPVEAIPEEKQWTYTRCVRDFCRTFVPQKIRP